LYMPKSMKITHTFNFFRKIAILFYNNIISGTYEYKFIIQD